MTPEEEAEWERLKKALASEKWDFRSVEGVAAELGLTRGRVRRLLARHEDKIRKALSRDRRVVYALKNKRVTAGEVLDRLVALAGR